MIDKVLHLLSVGKSDPGLKRCGVVFGRFDTRRVEEEAVLFGIANKNDMFSVAMVQMINEIKGVSTLLMTSFLRIFEHPL